MSKYRHGHGSEEIKKIRENGMRELVNKLRKTAGR
jgi:hypothetical protein